MAIIYIDNQPFEANSDNNLLHECLSLGFDLPYFCWHPALHSVGACRQCAVTQYKDENDQRGRIVMACMTPAADGTRIALKDEQSGAFRKTIIEWLMLNHPHDCPVCEEGGECHLQDMTVMTGHSFRRTRFPKRTFRNQNLGPCVGHEMNRCITCYRCVRFYQEYAGGRDLEAFGVHDNVYFGRREDGTLQSEFSGNLAEVCPTGVFTDKTLGERYTRKWDLRATPSICHHCSLGCNISPGERYGELRRIVNRYNHDVNGYFICDRGRYGYQFVNSPARVRQSHFEGDPLDHDDALARLATLTVEPRRLVGVGSPRASLEANFALRTLVGPERFSQGMTRKEAALVDKAVSALTGAARLPSVKETEQADAVLVLGEDVSNTAPRLALALRQTVRRKSYEISRQLGVDYWHDESVRSVGTHFQSPFFVATVAATRLDDIAIDPVRLSPPDVARLGFAVAHAINADAPAVPDLDDAARAAADRIAAVLKEAERPLVVSGTGCGDAAVIDAAANIAAALAAANPEAMLSMVVPECNSVGAHLAGGSDIETALDALGKGDADTLVILENDLFRRLDAATLTAALDTAAYVIVLDSLENDMTRAADLVLATGTFAEADGTLVNNEGRAQRFFRLFEPEIDIRAGWDWLRGALRANGRDEARGWHHLDQLTIACAQALPQLAGIEQAAVASDYRVAGMKAVREPARYSGRTAMLADRTVHEPKPPEDPDSALSYSMEGYQGAVPGSIQSFFWAPGWNSNQQAVNKFQDEIAGTLAAGGSGRRLFEPDGGRHFADAIPAGFTPRDGEWLAVPLHHVFGSEELSRHAPALQARAPVAHVVLNAEDAERLGLAEGAAVEVRMDGGECRLPLRTERELPAGVIGVLGEPAFSARLPAAVSLREAPA